MNLGLLGEKLSHTYSPSIHNLALKIINTPCNYQIFERKKEDIGALVAELKNNNLSGFNITIPYKIEIIKYLDEVSEEVKKIGACNTVMKKDNKIIGYNTDYFGLKATVEKIGAKVEGQKVVILGTGGASLASIELFLDLEVEEIYLFKREEDLFHNTKEKVKICSYSELKNIKDAILIVNCTPVGMYPNINDCLVSKELIKNYEYAIDLIYNPKETLFLQYARENNLKYSNGLYMLVLQALKADELWTGKNFNKEEVEFIYNEIENLVYKE